MLQHPFILFEEIGKIARGEAFGDDILALVQNVHHRRAVYVVNLFVIDVRRVAAHVDPRELVFHDIFFQRAKSGSEQMANTSKLMESFWAL